MRPPKIPIESNIYATIMNSAPAHTSCQPTFSLQKRPVRNAARRQRALPAAGGRLAARVEARVVREPLGAFKRVGVDLILT